MPTFIDIVPFLINIVPTNNLFLKKLLGDVLCDRFVISQGALVQDVLVNALAYVANADVAKAVHGPHLKWSYPDCYFRPKKLAHKQYTS